MKKIFLSVILSIFIQFSFADNTEGIMFFHGSWKEVTAKAKNQKKLIFIDFYTSWCGPCKQLSGEVFTLKHVGYVFNKNFINIKLDAEKGEGVSLAKQFYVGAFPTLLWVDSNGKLVHRAIGFMPSEKLLVHAQIALDGGNYNNDLEKNYKSHINNPEVVKTYLNFLGENRDSREKEVAQQYLSIIPKEKYIDEENYRLIGSFVQSPFSPAINYIIENRTEFDKKFTKENVDKIINGKYLTYADSLVWNVKDGKEFNEVAFQKLISLMKERNFGSTEQIIENTRIKVLRYKKDWKNYVFRINSLIEKGFYKDINFVRYTQWYKPILDSDCKEKDVLDAALGWINQSIEKDSCFNMTSYRNYWEDKIKILERKSDKVDDLTKARIELAFIKELEVKQESDNTDLKKTIKALIELQRK